MPIQSVQLTTSLKLADVRLQIPKFISPQSYYNLDNNSDLLHLIESEIQPISERAYNTIVIPKI